MSVHRARGRNGWRVRWREAGRQHERKFELKRDADALDREVARRKQLGPLAVQQLTARGGPTLGQWIEQRWAPEHAARSRRLDPRPLRRRLQRPHCALARRRASRPVQRPLLLRDGRPQRIKAGVSPGTIRKARTLLSSVLRHAAESGAITANPLSLVRAAAVGATRCCAAALTSHGRADPRRDAEPATARGRRRRTQDNAPAAATSCRHPAPRRPGGGTR